MLTCGDAESAPNVVPVWSSLSHNERKSTMTTSPRTGTAGSTLRICRESMDMTQREAGLLVGRSASHVGRIERGDLGLDDWYVRELSEALGRHMATPAAQAGASRVLAAR